MSCPRSRRVCLGRCDWRRHTNQTLRVQILCCIKSFSSSRLPTSDTTRALLLWVSPVATREMPVSHRSRIAPWSVASFGLTTNQPSALLAARPTDPGLAAGPLVSLFESVSAGRASLESLGSMAR